MARPAAARPAAVFDGAGRTGAIEPRDSRHAAAKPGRRGAAGGRHLQHARFVFVGRPTPAGANPPSSGGLHPRGAPVDLGSALAGPGDARSPRRAARVRQAGHRRQAGALRHQRHRNAAPVLGQGGESAVAHRAGSHYQRRPACRCEAHSPRAEVRRPRGRAARVRRRAWIRLRVSGRRRRPALRARDDAGARRGAGRPVQARRGGRAGHRSRDDCAAREHHKGHNGRPSVGHKRSATA